MPLLDIKQQSAEWYSIRRGKLTGSRVKDALSFLKNGEPSEARKKYMIELVCERLTDRMTDHFVTPAMEWGKETEDLAKAAYEVETGLDVMPVGIALHDRIEGFAASPDGLIGEDGLLECKCPTTSTHLKWILAGEIPAEHRLQMLSQLACTGRQWIDFVSFDPRLPERHQFFMRRMEASASVIAEVEDGAHKFLADVAAMVADLDRINPYISPAPQEEPPDPLSEAWLDAETIDRAFR